MRCPVPLLALCAPFVLMPLCGALPVPPRVKNPAPAPAPRVAGKAPLKGIHNYLCGIHCYSGQPERQVVAHHFCASAGEEVMQCIIYDSNRKDARLIGIEYIVSARVFKALPAEEKRLWHSHAYEVKGGVLAAPELGEAAEKALMKDLASTYGKTWHTWQVDRGDRVPLGIPQLMMALTGDGQAQAKAVADLDQTLNRPLDERRRRRADLPDPVVEPGADAWRLGTAWQLELKARTPERPSKIPLH